MEENPKKEDTSLWKMFLDDYMLLMFLGVAIYAVFYLIWGVMEIGSIQAIPEEIKNQTLNK